jgi:hypothetical protein
MKFAPIWRISKRGEKPAYSSPQNEMIFFRPFFFFFLLVEIS